MKTQSEYFQAHQVDGQLTTAQMTVLVNLPEGDSGLELPQSSEPAAAAIASPASDPGQQPKDPPDPAPKTEVELNAQNAVIAAKDGVHTISYDKLVEARETAKSAKLEAEALRLENEALKKAQTPSPAPAPATPKVDPDPDAAPAGEVDVFGDYSDAGIRKGIEVTVAARVKEATAAMEAQLSAALAPLQKKQEVEAFTAHQTAVYTAHPDLDAMVESQEFDAWKKAQPAYAQPGIEAVLTQGTAPQVIELFKSYKEATGKTAPPAPPDAKASAAATAAAAQAAIDKAKKAPPASLTDVPSGSVVQHDEAAALLEMSSAGLSRKFHGLNADQIEALIAKAL